MAQAIVAQYTEVKYGGNEWERHEYDVRLSDIDVVGKPKHKIEVRRDIDLRCNFPCRMRRRS
jgi:hypothetical protein